MLYIACKQYNQQYLFRFSKYTTAGWFEKKRIKFDVEGLFILSDIWQPKMKQKRLKEHLFVSQIIHVEKESNLYDFCLVVYELWAKMYWKRPNL